MDFGNKDEQAWKRARRPNYETNVNLKFPYSELPFYDKYYLVKIPAPDHIISHVDYWGEGRLVTEAGVSGFPDSYNVNRQYQCVSNSTDTGRKIPNRVPVFNWNTCDTSKYIRDDSVKLVTLMGAPIDKCAKDIARMVNPMIGQVIVFGFSDDSNDLKILQKELKRKQIFYCKKYPLPESVKGLTLFKSHHCFIAATDIERILFDDIFDWRNITDAVDIFKTLGANDGGSTISNLLGYVFDRASDNVAKLVHQLWENGAQDVVTKYFPKEYGLIFGGKEVKFTSKHYGLSLKLDMNPEENYRFAWGDASDKTIHRLKWKVIPEFVRNECVFKILNVQFGLYLLMAATADPYYGDRKVWGYTFSDEMRYRWYLRPVKVNGQLLFLVENKQYKQAWKLDSHTDPYGDRGLWGNNGDVSGSPGYYGFLIEEAN